MLIGQDFDKIEFHLFGLDLVEPNAFIFDTLICLIALFLAYKTTKINGLTPFFKYWKWFFIVFGLCFFFGGLGHVLYNYWGIPGRILPWYLGILAPFFIERAMISIHKKEKFRLVYNRLSSLKLILGFTTLTIVITNVNLEADPSVATIVPTIASTLGLLFALGYLGVLYSRLLTPKFKYFWISLLIMFPSIFLLTMKISLHQWCDRNDSSHVLNQQVN